MDNQFISNENLQSFNGNKFPNINNAKTNENNMHTKNDWQPFENMSTFKRNFSNVSELVHKCRNSRKLVLLVVFIALFFDNMLLTTVGKT